MRKLRRREFIEVVGASMASMSVFGSGAAGRAPRGAETIEKNGWQVKIGPTGEIVSFSDGKLELVNSRLGSNCPRVVVADRRIYACDQPKAVHRNGANVTCEYAFAGQEAFSVNYEIELMDLLEGSVALRQKVGIRSPRKIAESVKLELPRNIQLPYQNRRVFLPLKNGIGRKKPIEGVETDDEYVFSFAGAYDHLGKPQLLAIPMVDESADRTDLHLTLCTDPLFTSYVRLPARGEIGHFNCIYIGEVGLAGSEERTIYTGLHRGDERKAMEVFYATALFDVRPGPDWLHDVAMVDYDYLGKNGEGWFADIDALTRLVEPPDRHKIFLALDGCYDWIGRYSFNPRTKSLDRQWTSFANARDPQVQALGDLEGYGLEYGWRKSTLREMHPVPMSIPAVHRRIQYAKEKGFRVGLYFGDGTKACAGVKDIFDPDKVLYWGDWVGPDIKGRSYAQNPLHPEVRRFYLDYTDALLEEYGKEVDGFVWDETFVVRPHDLGPKPYTGYASRAMMMLVKELAAKVSDFGPDLAFLASDVIGIWHRFDAAAPYALVAHGTYQDSWCAPAAWPYGLFPNYRNVLWSCNWAAVTRFVYTRYGVETYGVPVAISNGPQGDGIGIAEMTPGMQSKILDLFNKRKRLRMRIGWVEESPWNLSYEGRKVDWGLSL